MSAYFFDTIDHAYLQAARTVDTAIADLRWALLKANFNPSQPRVPAGSPHGGQWVGVDGTEVGDKPAQPHRFDPLVDDPPIEPAYPLETLLGFLTAGQMLMALRSLRVGGQALATAPRNIKKAAEAIEKHLGGPGKVIRNKHGDTVIMRGDKKVRFDINNPGRDKPHFQFERRTKNGKWRNDGKKHRYHFKDK